MTLHQPEPNSAQRLNKLSRRELLAYSAAFGASFAAAGGVGRAASAQSQAGASNPNPGKEYSMKKSINLWALPYPDDMSLETCFDICADAGFEGVEVNYDIEGELSPEASEDELRAIGGMAREKGLEIAGLCSFLFWPFSLTHEDPDTREEGIELAKKMVRAARLLGTEELLVVPGAVYVPWLPDEPPVPHDVADERAKDAVNRVLEVAREEEVHLNIENIFTNGFLHSPQEINAFVDYFDSEYVQVHFDTGNIMLYHFPEHWIPILGDRIRHVHLKEYNKNLNEFNLNAFRTLLDGTTNWPAVLDAFEAVGYTGYLTFEYFNPFPYHPEAIAYHTSDALDRMLGRKG
ncbi:MAG: sugar phosphate isomerase/epimerase family protein [Candidatus Hydrogenedentota bacterium]